MRRSISSSVNPAIRLTSVAMEIDTTSWSPSRRIPPRLNRSSMFSWNSIARRLRLLGGGAKLGQPPAPEIGVLGAVPHVPPEQELGRELRGERDPPAEHPHHPLLDVSVASDTCGGLGDGEVTRERVKSVKRASSAVIDARSCVDVSCSPNDIAASAIRRTALTIATGSEFSGLIIERCPGGGPARHS